MAPMWRPRPLIQSLVLLEGIGARASMIEGDPRRDRSYRIAMELLHTERTYVDVLHLLDQVGMASSSPQDHVTIRIGIRIQSGSESGSGSDWIRVQDQTGFRIKLDLVSGSNPIQDQDQIRFRIRIKFDSGSN